MFKVIEWKDWVENINKNTTEQIKDDLISVDDLINAPKLDPENPKPFCERFMFEQVYESNVFVKHPKEKNCYWYIAVGEASLIYHPQLID
jgi:hypothetical protein